MFWYHLIYYKNPQSSTQAFRSILDLMLLKSWLWPCEKLVDVKHTLKLQIYKDWSLLWWDIWHITDGNYTKVCSFISSVNYGYYGTWSNECCIQRKHFHTFLTSPVPLYIYLSFLHIFIVFESKMLQLVAPADIPKAKMIEKLICCIQYNKQNWRRSPHPKKTLTFE